MRLVADDEVLHEASFEILPDPRVDTDDDDYAAQATLLGEIDEAVSDAHRAVVLAAWKVAESVEGNRVVEGRPLGRAGPRRIAGDNPFVICSYYTKNIR